jgi:hypothetical protein
MRRSGVVLLILCAAALCACQGRSATYRYKLTLSLDTPDGAKTGFNVVEVDYRTISIPEQGEPHKTTGRALYVDLGPGRRPLIALLTHIRRADERPNDIHWLEDDPIRILARVCLDVTAIYSWIDVASKFDACKRPFPITTADLPDLVTFADVNNPKSVMLVDPNNLAGTLGPGVAWRSMTLQATDEPLTKGIENHLLWLRHYAHLIPIKEINSFDYGTHTFLTLLNFIRGN